MRNEVKVLIDKDSQGEVNVMVTENDTLIIDARLGDDYEIRPMYNMTVKLLKKDSELDDMVYGTIEEWVHEGRPVGRYTSKFTRMGVAK